MFDIPKKATQLSSTKATKTLPIIRLTMEEIKQLSDDELLKLLSGEGRDGAISAPLLQAISYELTSRQIQRASKPHWTVKPTFYAVIFFGLMTIVIGILSLLK
ncbi:hypothetical protein ACFODO_23920 [Acinetobacter sichuanensis]|uniref:Uncharacterized protein n=1 Tax=Acinetobacter sichuanensis TaxID=2136183 RepID=A0ABV7BNL8_9GAMM|nr:hypothetical protein [Acinetobacter sichuanensis]